MLTSIRSRLSKYLRAYKLARKYKGDFRHKSIYFKYALKCMEKGVIHFRVDRIASEYADAYFEFSELSDALKKKLTDYGVAPFKVHWYGLNEDNLGDYLSDYDFYSPRTYVKNTYLEFFENKLNTYLLLAPFKSYMPKHYWFVENGASKIMPIDVEANANGSVDDIVNLIDECPIAAKSCYGGHGHGFFLLESIGGRYFVNRSETSADELRRLLSSLKGYIITEYCKPHGNILKNIGNDSFAVMRIVMVYDEKDGPQLTAAVIRLGCKEGGVVTDYHGTIYCGISIEDGRTFKPIWRETDTRFHPIDVHPDTGKLLSGMVIPNWNELKKLAFDVSRYLPWTPYLVMDIIPTERGFAILEINSHGQVRNTEAHYPALKNPYMKRLFTK